MRTVTCSAPGKALLLGGYLVLEPSHPGLVAAASCRFRCVVSGPHKPGPHKPGPHKPGPHKPGPHAPGVTPGPLRVVVRSEQLRATWEYEVSFPPPPAAPPPGPAAGYAALERVPLPELRLSACSSVAHGRLPAPGAEHGSRFVEAALRAALGYARRHGPVPGGELPGGELRVELRADGGFYSEGSPEVVDDDAAPTGKRVQVNKTGMGSSACLTTSLVGALLSFLATPLPPGVLLNLSQLAHCASQGKVGSGFDVAAAVSGGQLYTRFPREVLTAAGPLEGGVGRLAWVAEGLGAIVAGAYQPEAPAGAPPLWGAG
ncbi:hypothetical protein TeGR_g6693, partial [Tetraparma gracilis]